MGVRTVLDEVDAGRPADGQQRAEVDREPVEMDDEECFGLPRQPAADLLGVRAQVPVLHIDQQRPRLEPPDGLQGGDKSVGGQDHLSTLADAARGQPED